MSSRHLCVPFANPGPRSWLRVVASFFFLVDSCGRLAFVVLGDDECVVRLANKSETTVSQRGNGLTRCELCHEEGGIQARARRSTCLYKASPRLMPSTSSSAIQSGSLAMGVHFREDASLVTNSTHPPSPTILFTLSSSTLLSRPSFLCPFGPPVRAFAIALRNRSRSSIFCCLCFSASSRAFLRSSASAFCCRACSCSRLNG